MRYFERHPALLMRHTTSRTQQGRIRFRAMFEEFSPDAYVQIYSFPLSTFAHGSANIFFRAEFFAPEIGGSPARMRPILGSRFDSRKANFCYLFIANVTQGLVNCYPVFFPHNTIASDPELEARVASVQRELQTQIDFVRRGSQATTFHAAMASIIAP